MCSIRVALINSTLRVLKYALAEGHLKVNPKAAMKYINGPYRRKFGFDYKTKVSKKTIPLVIEKKRSKSQQNPVIKLIRLFTVKVRICFFWSFDYIDFTGI